jgi:hypothetical protein
MEEDQFCRVSKADDNMPEVGGMQGNDDAFKQLAAEGIKLNLNDMYNEMLKMFDTVKSKVSLLH